MMTSVIVPFFNSKKTIGKCLRAVTEQSYPSDSYEVIVVDDGSTDNSGEIAKSYPVKYIQIEHRGPATARNLGVQEAKGEIILFTDADCVVDENWVKEMVESFSDPETMAVKGAYKSEQKSLMARFVQLEFEERFELLKKAKSTDMIDTYSAGFRRNVFLELGGFDTSFPIADNEDTEFSYRMSKLGYKMIFNPKAQVSHLSHADSIKKYAKVKLGRGYWRMVVYKKFPDKMLKDTYTPQTLKLEVIFIYLSLFMSLIALFQPILWPVLFFSIAAFVALTLPFTIFAMRSDVKVGILAPFFLLVRGAAIGAGIIKWVLLNYLKRK